MAVSPSGAVPPTVPLREFATANIKATTSAKSMKTRLKPHLNQSLISFAPVTGPLTVSRSIALLLIITLSSTWARAQNLLVNGSFEEPAVTSNLNFQGAFSFPGWSGFSTGSGPGGGNAGIVPGVNFGLAPYDGNQAFSFNGNNPPPGTYIEQTFQTSPGLEYSVTLAVGRNNGFPSQALELFSQVFDSTGNQLASLTSAPPSTVGYSPVSFSFVADSDSSRLRFTDVSGSNPNTDLFIDAVAVSEVPEPSAPALIVLAAVGPFGRPWPFRRRVRI